jgi:hypothetical protein
MNAYKLLLSSLLISLGLPAFAGQSGNISVSHYEPLQRMSLQAKSPASQQKLTISAPLVLEFDALGQSFDLRLVPNTRFLSAAARNSLPAGIEIYRGGLADNAASWVRIVMFEGMPRGFIWDGKEMYAIEVPGDSIVATTAPIIYRLSDTFIEPGSMTCGSQSLSGNGAEAYSKIVGELSKSAALAPGAVSEIDIGAVGDFEFTHVRGDADAVVAITDRMNRVDGIYSQEIGVQINVPFIETFIDPDLDPFSDTLDPSLLLVDVATYREGSTAQNNLGLTHLWTGRNLEGTTVGIAYNGNNNSGVLCRRDVGAGLSEGNDTPGFDSLVAAHEIGHNFGAPHDGVAGACEAEPQDFIMAPMLNRSNEFSECSKTIMQANVARASCVTALPTVDVSIALNNPTATVLLGADTVLTYDITNNGSAIATNVSVDIDVPANLSIDSVTTSIGSCMNGAGAVSCTLGDVPGLSDNTIAIATTPATVGAGVLTATIAADVDERSGNNVAVLQLTVDAAVDLSVDSLPSTTVILAQNATIVASLQNLSVMDATGVTLSVSFGGRVAVESAVWSIGSCTVAAQQVDCQATDFANLSSSTLTLGIMGLTAGNQSYSVEIASQEADADLSNNTLSGSATVRDPAKKDESGGAVGLPMILILGLLAIVTRRSGGRFGNQRTQAA